jgi:DNA polymerase III subunit delta'
MNHNEIINSDLWNDIVGQNKAKEILNNIFVSRRVPHAFLFYGPDGAGKFFTAIQFLKLMNSEINEDLSKKYLKNLSSLSEPAVKLVFSLPRGKGETGDDSSYEKLPQDTIDIITEQINRLSVNPYFRLNIPGANTIKISSIRDIKKFSNFSDGNGIRKGVIVYDAHLMADEAQNALLKSLEEPPEDLVFFLITSNKERLLPTILSRCWQVKFNPLSDEQIKDILVKYFEIEEKKAKMLAGFSDGSLTTALNLIKYDLDNILLTAVQTIRFALAKRYYLANKAIEDSIDISSKENVQFFIAAIIKWLKDANKNKYTGKIDSFNEYRDTIEKFNSKFNNADLAKSILKLEQLTRLVDNNLNLNIILLGIIFVLSALSVRN